MATLEKAKDKLLKVLNPKLNTDERHLLQLIHIEPPRKDDKMVFRMPVGIIALDGIWEKIVETCDELKIPYLKAGLHATLEELDGILGEVEWLWQPLIPKGFITMVVGDPGVGKSALMLDFVKVITNGLHFPLSEEKFGKPQSVVWIDTEASQQLLNIRAKSMLIDRSKIHIPVIDGDLLSQPNIGIEEHRDQIINLVQYCKPALLILDSLGGSHSRGENKVEEMRPVMEFFALLSRDEKIAVAIIHHLNKGRDGESSEVALYRIRGSTIIPALSRSILALETITKDSLKLRCIKSNLARIGEPMVVIPINKGEEEIIGFTYDWYKAPPPKRTKKETCAIWAMEILEKHKDKRVKLTDLIELGETNGYTRGNIYAAKELLGEQVLATGTGNRAFWQVASAPVNDIATINKLTKGKNNGR